MRASLKAPLLAVTLLCAGLSWAVRVDAQEAKPSAPAAARPGLELVMVERVGCAWCARWNADVAPIYPKAPESADAPLRRHDLGDGQPKEATRPVRYTPTFLLVREGKEVGRVTGYLDAGMFWGLLDQLIARAKADGAGQG